MEDKAPIAPSQGETKNPENEVTKKVLKHYHTVPQLETAIKELERQNVALQQCLERYEKPFDHKADTLERRLNNCLLYVQGFMNEGLWYVQETRDDDPRVALKVKRLRVQLISLCTALREVEEPPKEEVVKKE